MSDEADLHEAFKITRIIKEAGDVKTFMLEPVHPGLEYEARPGQFVMAWIPGVSENPFSVAGVDPLELTVKLRGDFTQALFEKREGDKLLVRGPYGTSFLDFCDFSGDEHFESYYIAGGYGTVPIRFLYDWRLASRKEPTILLGAKTREDVLFGEAFRRYADLRIATEDGSLGTRGLVTDLMGEIPEDSYVFACGPEKMLLAVAEKAEKRISPKNIILSVERYMKCGQGICRCCEIVGSEEAGLSVCQDGPVFTYAQLKGGSLGKYHREKSGLKKYL
jgi:dihydroorotate dehydrogenase electron transfer subunit